MRKIGNQVRIALGGALATGLTAVCTATAQGTFTFNQPAMGANHIAFLWFYQDGIGVLGIAPQVPDNYILRLRSVAGHPTNGTPHMEHVRFGAIPSYASFGLADGGAFGLASVDLADSVAPSLSPVSITFNGFKGDGSLVSQTFTVGGGGASSFQTVTFGPDFAHGLLRVEIPSSRWAMDNLVWIPEPAATSLLLLGLGALAVRRRRSRP